MTVIMPASLPSGHEVSADEYQAIIDALTPLWVVSNTSATPGSAVGTTETVAFTASSGTYRANTAYRINFHGLIRCNTAPAVITFAIRDTNASGTVRMSGLSYKIDASGVNRGCDWEVFVANQTSSDITGRVLVGTIVSDSGANTVIVNAGSTTPYHLMCTAAGLYTNFPQAVAL